MFILKPSTSTVRIPPTDPGRHKRTTLTANTIVVDEVPSSTDAITVVEVSINVEQTLKKKLKRQHSHDFTTKKKVRINNGDTATGKTVQKYTGQSEAMIAVDKKMNTARARMFALEKELSTTQGLMSAVQKGLGTVQGLIRETSHTLNIHTYRIEESENHIRDLQLDSIRFYGTKSSAYRKEVQV